MRSSQRSRVAIISAPGDYESHAMATALERKGAEVIVLFTPDFPRALTLTVDPTGERPRFACTAGDAPVALGPLTSVLLRGVIDGELPDGLDADDTAAIRRETAAMRDGFLACFAPEALWVNGWRERAVARDKAAQLIAARTAGVAIPPTLMTNDPDELARFIDRVEGRVVYKSFTSLLPTIVLEASDLPEPELLRLTPGIFQRYVDKEYELRIVAVGRRLFPVRINSQQTEDGRIDWRMAASEDQGGDLGYEPVTIPDAFADACRAVMDAFGLVFGCIDAIVTPAGEHVFLELNPGGMFAWLNRVAGVPVIDALSEMLVQGHPDYAWEPGATGFVYDREVREIAFERKERALATHIGLAPRP